MVEEGQNTFVILSLAHAYQFCTPAGVFRNQVWSINKFPARV